MRLATRQFASYAVIGVFNTLIHGAVFLVLTVEAGLSQALSNLCGFALAVTFSLYANARYTFTAQRSWPRYLKFVSFMGALSAAVGYLADLYRLPPLITWAVFSVISLVCGFLYSKRVIFREHAA